MTLPYDSVLLVSFGGPEHEDEVLPFLRRVTAGRGIPDERLVAVSGHYYELGGRSPLNDQVRALAAALHTELERRGHDIPVRVGNRNTPPWITDTLRQCVEAGDQRVVVILTSAYSSYSGCRQYRENLADALTELTADGTDTARLPRLDKIVTYGPTGTFIEPVAQLTAQAVSSVLATGVHPDRMRLAFVTHSIPQAANRWSGPVDQPGTYVEQHADVQEQVVAAVVQFLGERLAGPLRSAAVYCSRSGAPAVPWLEPDINDYLVHAATDGVEHVIVVPHGFISDHMEVIWDLDHEAAATARRLGIGFTRVPTVGTGTEFVSGLIDLVEARGSEPRIGADCPVHCCRPGRPGAQLRPAACGC